MLLTNFDFSNLRPIEKLLAINIPVVLAECLTYPLIRIQSLVFTSKLSFQLSPIRQVEYYMRTMQKEEQFPRYMAGLRYSIDHSITYTTARFLMFEYFMKRVKEWSKGVLYGGVLLATTIGTVISQPPFNYRLLASELPINKYRHQEIKNRFLKIDKIKILKAGLGESILLNCLLATGEMSMFFAIKNHYNGFSTDFSQILPAFLIYLTTSLLAHPLHRHRILTIHNAFTTTPLPNRYSFQGVWTSIFRRTIYSTLLFSMYAYFMHWQIKRQIEMTRGSKKWIHQNVQLYREGKSMEEVMDEMRMRTGQGKNPDTEKTIE